MNRRSLFLIVASSLLIATGTACGGAPHRVADQRANRFSALQTQIDTLCNAAIERDHVVGMEVAILDGPHQWTRGYGLTRVGGSVPNERTIFEIGSITKTFTSLLLADMVTRGEVSLATPVQELLPSDWHVPTFEGTAITLEDIATHSSGLPSDWPGFTGENAHDPFHNFDLTMLRDGLNAAHVIVRPGSNYEYNNFATAVLGFALAHRLGMTYEAALQARVLAPLHLTEMWLNVPASEASRAVLGHYEDGTESPMWSTSAIAPAGNLHATAPELLRYAQAHLDPESALRDAMLLATAPRRPTQEDVHASIGLGWHIIQNGRTIFHNGQGSMRAFLGIDRTHGYIVVVLSNTRGGVVDALGYNLLAVLRGEPTASPPAPAIALTAEQMEALVGRYALSSSFALDVRVVNGVLETQATGQEAIPLDAISPTVLRVHGVAATLTFELGEGGRATRVTLNQNGRDMPAERVDAAPQPAAP
ncbi:MAG: serine hydrolase [Sandaracinaceae bacterium]|jgi:D-alanyl-D-alanine-carboxypeptidase/D-alanyl-D-alanine-endopeptidase|nr:serine hydrolase [Sandaracinaceae bacterium]